MIVTRTFAATVESSLLRTASFEGRDHLVVPVVALIGNRVYNPMNSTGPEYVPLALLEAAPSCWDSKPVVPDHPGSGTLSACTPDMIESYAFGRIFNGRVENGRLKMDVYLDRDRAAFLGGLQQRVIERLDAGQPVEVSVGARTILERRSGISPSGVRYSYVWSGGVYPDHLAILPEGTLGACSNEDGCGAPRAAARKEAVNMTLVDSTTANPDANTVGISTTGTGTASSTPHADPGVSHDWIAAAREQNEALLKILADLRGLALNTTSDSELREALSKALFASEPGFMGVLDVYPDEKRVVYYTMDGDSNYHLYRSNYTSGDDGSYTFSRKAEVRAVTKYETAQAATDTPVTGTPVTDTPSPAPSPVPPCSCHPHPTSTTSDSNAAALAHREGVVMPANEKVKDLVGRLLANAAAPYVEADRAVLESFCEERLTEIVERTESLIEAATADVGTPDTPTSEITEEQAIAALPSALKRLLAAAQAAEAAERKDLLATLSTHKQVKLVHTPAALAEKSIDELRGLATLLDLPIAIPGVTYSAARLHGAIDPSDTPTISEAPKPYTQALKKIAGGSQPSN